MKRPFKCAYCDARSVTTHEDEFLCNRHYMVLYDKSIVVPQLEGVSQIPIEKELKEKYMLILANYNFTNVRKTDKIIKEFLKDVEHIKIKNKLYHKH